MSFLSHARGHSLSSPRPPTSLTCARGEGCPVLLPLRFHTRVQHPPGKTMGVWSSSKVPTVGTLPPVGVFYSSVRISLQWSEYLLLIFPVSWRAKMAHVSFMQGWAHFIVVSFPGNWLWRDTMPPQLPTFWLFLTLRLKLQIASQAAHTSSISRNGNTNVFEDLKFTLHEWNRWI